MKDPWSTVETFVIVVLGSVVILIAFIGAIWALGELFL